MKYSIWAFNYLLLISFLLFSCSNKTLLEQQTRITELEEEIEQLQQQLDLYEDYDSYRQKRIELRRYQDFFKRVDARRIIVSGSFSYPSEGIPNNVVAVMRNLVTGETYSSQPFSESTGGKFNLEVPMGFYHCYMYRDDYDYWGRVYENILVIPPGNLDLDRDYPKQ